MKTILVLLALVCALVLAFASGTAQERGPLRVGIIGVDTSHALAFTKILNNPKNEGDLAGLRVVAAFPGGSADVPASANRVQKYAAQLKEMYGVEMVESVDDLVKKVDVILLESVDGRPHLNQATPALKSGKRVFIDKPVAGSLADVLRIFDLARKHNAPVFSSSGLRFSKGIAAARNDPKLGKVLGCTAWSPCEIETHHPDLFWYGIHGVETLYTVMGPGCKSVTRAHSKGADVVTGVWADGRIGTFRGLRAGRQDFGALVFGEKAITPTGGFTGYDPLVKAIARFLKTGQAPVRAEETIEIYAFMEAADESKRQGGAPVTLESVLKKARAANRQAP